MNVKDVAMTLQVYPKCELLKEDARHMKVANF